MSKMSVAMVKIRREDGATAEVVPSALPVWLRRGWVTDSEQPTATEGVVSLVRSGVVENTPTQ